MIRGIFVLFAVTSTSFSLQCVGLSRAHAKFQCLFTNPLTLQKKSSNMPVHSISAEVSSDLSTAVDYSWTNNIPSLTRLDFVNKLLEDGKFAKVYADNTVFDAIETMNAANKGSVVVIDRNENLAGIFTERDFVTKIIDANRVYTETRMDSVMTPLEKLIVGKFNDTLSDCRQLMLKNNIRHLPIVNSENKPIGIVSMRELIKSLQVEELYREKATLVGLSLSEVQTQAKIRANTLALQMSEEKVKQDTVRAGFIAAAAAIGVALLQGSWVHDHEWLSMCLTFLLGYVGIIFETYFEFNKAGIALIMATALWAIFAGTAGATGVAISSALGDLSEKVSEVSEVVFFLLGAMTIVEIVDAHQGFKVVTDRIQSKDKRSLLRVIGAITFFMSAILDNLTTTIVMVSLTKKLLSNPDDRKFFGAMIVIAANAGGAWTPIGDVTTTMLWINGQITAIPTILDLFLPSLASVIISILALETQLPDDKKPLEAPATDTKLAPRGQLVFTTGILGLLSVPVFKAVTGLPPYLGMLAALGVMWSLTDAIHAGEDQQELKAPAALKKIDTSGVLFFLGILLSIGALDSAGILKSLAEFLDQNIPDGSIVAALIGFASAVIDNVPLVAATMGMYSLNDVPADSQLWQLIAYCAGTGGSLLVIGSAAGVALMGLEKVDFLWYAKRITLSALAGYLGGIGVYLAQHSFSSFPQFPALF
eukprot:gene13263-17769_t